MKTVFSIWIWLAAAASHGAEELFPETDRRTAEIEELRKSIPEVVEADQLTQTLVELEKRQESFAAAKIKRLKELQESDAYIEFEEKRNALMDKREDAWEVERKIMAEEAQKIYSARHEEIRAKARRRLPGAGALGLDVLNFPRVDGSTSTGPLSVIVASRILGLPYVWEYTEPTGRIWHDAFDAYLKFKLTPEEYDKQNRELSLNRLAVVAQPERREQLRIAKLINSEISVSTTTHDGYVNLIEGHSDLTLSARPPSASERKLAAEKGVNLILKPIAMDAFVFLVNRKNPVKSLSRAQVRDIYEKRVVKWDDLGWAGGQIQAFRRQRDSGSRELFDQLVMGVAETGDDDRNADLYSSGMAGPFNQVTRDAAGIGYSVYYYEHFMAASPYTRLLAIDGVEPSFETISSGAYPWVTPVYAVCREGVPADSPGMRLLEWLLTEEGQSVVLESGYVPVRKP